MSASSRSKGHSGSTPPGRTIPPPGRPTGRRRPRRGTGPPGRRGDRTHARSRFGTRRGRGGAGGASTGHPGAPRASWGMRSSPRRAGASKRVRTALSRGRTPPWGGRVRRASYPGRFRARSEPARGSVAGPPRQSPDGPKWPVKMAAPRSARRVSCRTFRRRARGGGGRRRPCRYAARVRRKMSLFEGCPRWGCSWLLLRTFCGKNGKGRERSQKVMYGYVVTF